MIRVAIVEDETVYAHQLEDHLIRCANEHELAFAIRLLRCRICLQGGLQDV